MSGRYLSTQAKRRQDDAFTALVAVARRLQAPGGCAWDRAQTVDSLLPYLIEETWEVFEAIRRRRRAALPEELGDVLYTVLFLTLIAERRGWFRLEHLLQATRRKMIRRHPHVFGNAPAPTPETALVAAWDRRLTGRSRRPSGSLRRPKTRSPGRG
jgi:uncharacterized protein YabN with tetrapyrrole methylase and pyrophosphatase domain